MVLWGSGGLLTEAILFLVEFSLQQAPYDAQVCLKKNLRSNKKNYYQQITWIWADDFVTND
jgi:hypothetical protein